MVVKNLRQIFMLAVLAGFLTNTALAAEMLGSNRKFRTYNPDWKKYEFTRDYITSLGYLKKNYDREGAFSFQESEPNILNSIARMRDELIQENVNLRVARNYLKRYRNQTRNGLMLKVSDMFTNVCNELIELNSEQRLLLEEMHSRQRNGELDEAVAATFEKRQLSINRVRRESLKKLLRSSILVTKVLVSPHENYYGEFDRLGITQEQRYKLLNKVKSFDEAAYSGELRSGQSFLEGSVVAIREILEDYDYDSLDG